MLNKYWRNSKSFFFLVMSAETNIVGNIKLVLRIQILFDVDQAPGHALTKVDLDTAYK